jgi:hypothetical protein
MRIRFSRVPVLVAGLACALAGTAGAQTPAAAPSRNVWVQALTGLNALNTASVVYSGLGTAIISGNTLQPVSAFRVAINYGMEMLAVEVDQAEKPHHLGQYLAEGKAWDVVEKKLVARPTTVAERVRLIAMTPQGVMKAAQDAGTKRVMADEMLDGTRVTTMTIPVGTARLKAYFDDKTMITRVHTLSGDGSAGKDVVEFLYSGYRNYDTLTPLLGPPPGGAASAMAYGGIPFPSHIVQKVNGAVILDIGLTEVVLNQGVTIEVPPSVERAHARK